MWISSYFLITHQYIQTIVSFYSLLINYFDYILWNENFRLIRLNFHVCVQISVALFLPSPLSRYFCDIVILRDPIYSLSSIKATTNHYSYRNSIIVKWPNFSFSLSFIFGLIVFSPPSLFFYLPYLLPRRSYLYIYFSTLNQLKRKNNKTVRNISSIILMTTTKTMMKDFVVHFLWCIQWNSFIVLQTMKEKPKNYNIYCRMSSRSSMLSLQFNMHKIPNNDESMLLLID